MGLNEIYEAIATTSQGAIEKIRRNPLSPYLAYGRYLLFAQGPKLSYVNNYEPEYTRKTIKYNAPIVLSMFAATFVLSELVRNSRQKKH